MSKVCLVFDKPKNCAKCPVRNEWNSTCSLMNIAYPQTWHPLQRKGTVPGWCPLRPLPERYYVDQNNIYDVAANQTYADGWNDCLDEIMGGADDRQKESD